MILNESLIKAEPVLVGCVALRDSEEAGETCLGCEVVVVVGEEHHGTVIVADAKNVEFRVVKLCEIGLSD